MAVARASEKFRERPKAKLFAADKFKTGDFLLGVKVMSPIRDIMKIASLATGR